MTTVSVSYPGPHDAIVMPDTGERVERGQSIDVDPDQAAQLLAQGWLKGTDGPKSDTIPAITKWVDGDPVKAALMLDREQAKGDRARSSLIDQLTELIATNPAPAESSEEDI